MNGKKKGWFKKKGVGIYLLDTYPAAFAVSLRKLKTGVTNVIRFRRNSDDAERDFTATEITDGTLTTWLGGATAYCRTLYDQSGNGNHLTQTTNALQPSYFNNSLFYANSYMTVWNFAIAPSIFQDISDAISLFYVHESNSGAGGAIPYYLWYLSNTIIEMRTNLGTGTHAPLIVGNDNNFANYNVTDDHTAGTDKTQGTITMNNKPSQYLVSNFINGDDLSLFVNGATDVTKTFTTTASGDRSVGNVSNSTLSIGARSKNTGIIDSDFYDGEISEIILMKTYEGANRTVIESDINTHYSIY